MTLKELKPEISSLLVNSLAKRYSRSVVEARILPGNMRVLPNKYLGLIQVSPISEKLKPLSLLR